MIDLALTLLLFLIITATMIGAIVGVTWLIERMFFRT